MNRRDLIGAAMTGIEHDCLDALGILDAARTQNRFDELADVERRDQMRVRALEQLEMSKEADAVDVELARPGLRANAAPFVAQ